VRPPTRARWAAAAVGNPSAMPAQNTRMFALVATIDITAQLE
jgi:hypothetical protein